MRGEEEVGLLLLLLLLVLEGNEVTGREGKEEVTEREWNEETGCEWREEEVDLVIDIIEMKEDTSEVVMKEGVIVEAGGVTERVEGIIERGVAAMEEGREGVTVETEK